MDEVYVIVEYYREPRRNEYREILGVPGGIKIHGIYTDFFEAHRVMHRIIELYHQKYWGYRVYGDLPLIDYQVVPVPINQRLVEI